MCFSLQLVHAIYPCVVASSCICTKCVCVCVYIPQNNDLLKTSHSRVLHEMEALSQQLKEVGTVRTKYNCSVTCFTQERGRTSKVESQLHDSRLSQRTITELQGMVEELRGEKDRLREANDRLARRCVYWGGGLTR